MISSCNPHANNDAVGARNPATNAETRCDKLTIEISLGEVRVGEENEAGHVHGAVRVRAVARCGYVDAIDIHVVWVPRVQERLLCVRLVGGQLVDDLSRGRESECGCDRFCPEHETVNR